MQFLRKNLKLVSQKTIIRKNPNQIIILRPINYIRLKKKKNSRNAKTEHLEFSLGSYFNFIV